MNILLIAVAIVAIGCMGNASADIYADVVRTPMNKGNMDDTPTLSKANKIWTKCRKCAQYEPAIKDMLRLSGFTVVDSAGDADTRIVFLATINVPKDRKVSELPAEDLAEACTGPLPAALGKLGNESQEETSSARRGVLDMDAGVIGRGSQITGSSTGGIVIGLAGALVGGLFDQRAAEAKRVPGVANVSVRVASPDASYFFALMAAADSVETPDALLRASFAKAVDILSSGGSVRAATSKGRRQ